MSYDEDFAALALRMIDAKGGLITVRAVRQAPPDPSKDRPTVPPTKLTVTVMGVVLPVARRFLGSDVFETGTLITAAHRMAYIAGPSMTWAPEQGDTVDSEGNPWRVDGTITLRPNNGVPILYTVIFHK